MASAGPSRSRKTSTSRAEPWQKSVLCKYYINGLCNKGQECAWSHDRNLANKKTLPCKYFSAGTCAYGDNCRFSHGQQFPPLNPFAPEFKGKSASDNQQELGAKPKSQPKQEMTPSVSTSKSWADAPEFVPQQEAADEQNRTWAQVVDPVVANEMPIDEAESELCPFSMTGECRYGEHCDYVHGLVCDLCGSPSLHPYHERQREHHQKMCMKQHEKAMELAFASQRSKDKTCGICMEVVVDKKSSEARFGIMPNCNHCYCLACLRKWRSAKQFEHKIVRACPECRVTSDYICPSKYWIDTKEEKDKLLADYKGELNKKKCKYFNEGKGECPFGNKCFYRHEDSSGNHVDVGPPEQQKRRVIRFEDDYINIPESLQGIYLHEFMQLRIENGGGALLLSDLLDMVNLYDDLEDSDSDDWFRTS